MPSHPSPGFGLGIGKPQLTGKLTSSTFEFSVLQLGQHVASVQGPVLFLARKALFDEPLPAPRQRIADLSSEAQIPRSDGLLRDQFAVTLGAGILVVMARVVVMAHRTRLFMTALYADEYLLVQIKGRIGRLNMLESQLATAEFAARRGRRLN